MATIRYQSTDLDAAAAWYSQITGVEPYFQVPGYIEFRVGPDEDELGIMLVDEVDPGATVLYWQVDDCQVAVDALIAAGATEREAPREFGEGFIAASVYDPFGNVLGVMENPHFAERHAVDA